MARVTVEDCEKKVPNKYELLLLAAKRARDIEMGASLAVPRDNDKSTIVALREIADDAINIDGLRSIAKAEIVREDMARDYDEKTDLTSEPLDDDLREDEDDEEFDDDDDYQEDIESIGQDGNTADESEVGVDESGESEDDESEDEFEE